VSRTYPTVRQLLLENSAALNLIRLVLALLVLVSHTYPLGGFGADPAWPTLRPSTSLGGFAVGAFFALSGLLVTMSGLRRSPYEFIRSRFLRIVPAYLVVVVVAAALLGPAVWLSDHGTLHGYFNFGVTGPAMYVARNLLFPVGLQYAINDVFATSTPYGLLTGTSAVNGSLWTLPMELRCYLVALAVVVVGRGLGSTRVATAALGFVAGILFVTHFSATAGQAITPAFLVPPLPELLFVFLCGAVLGTVATRLHATPLLFAAAVFVFLLASIGGGLYFRTVGLGCLAIILPGIAALLPAKHVGFFRNDLSYGTYVWAFPVQQTLAYAGLATSKIFFILTAGLATLILAALSWFFVEQPALRLRHRSSLDAPWKDVTGTELLIPRVPTS
jgi:peptidoglycan/LPS O-acetylase OafA/YrhL